MMLVVREGQPQGLKDIRTALLLLVEWAALNQEEGSEAPTVAMRCLEVLARWVWAARHNTRAEGGAAGTMVVEEARGTAVEEAHHSQAAA